MVFEGRRYALEKTDKRWRVVEPEGWSLQSQADVKALRGGPGAAVSEWAAAKALAPSYDLCDPKSVLEALRRLSALDLPDQDRELEGFYRQWNKRQVIRD